MAENNLENLFSEEDLLELEQLQKAKSNILKNIGINNFIEMMREIIDEAEHFEFASAIKRKFININTPIFTLKKKDYKADLKKINNEKYVDAEIDKIVAEINNEILSKTTKRILDIIQNDEKLKIVYSNLKEDLKDLMWTTVFEIKVSIKDNLIYMRYCI